ncbi:tail fiber assembly protein [Edwardsiella tarda]|uniref:tail fiber assembly protein n=1 Tax=Edwardsiella tarda TaxID=636 RepID=UPI000BE22592|nr:tail fiber assembly protein [Edwardsiella tarda]ATI63784.1 phage tail protein [Edwardsiella tarda]
MKTDYKTENGDIVDVSNPKRIAPGVIEVTIQHSILGVVPFTALPSDVMDYGRDIYARCLNGDFGPILVAESTPTVVSSDEPANTAEQKKQSLLTMATNAIAPLQDAVDLSEATPDEEARLKAWKRFRVEVNRVDTSAAPNISWPAQPE